MSKSKNMLYDTCKATLTSIIPNIFNFLYVSNVERQLGLGQRYISLSTIPE